MLPEEIKLVRRDSVLMLIDEVTDSELCRLSDESDLSEDEGKAFLKAVVRLWQDHNPS